MRRGDCAFARSVRAGIEQLPIWVSDVGLVFACWKVNEWIASLTLTQQRKSYADGFGL